MQWVFRYTQRRVECDERSGSACSASSCHLGVAAQETRGNISGTVRDAQGVVPGAMVTVTNVDTQVTQNLVTNDSGYFEAPLLNPGTTR